MEKHHALLYLSPAGDPEFGEVKPLMVDLRGIEEIARLHLLHNIPGRFAPPSGAEAVPAAPTHVPWQSHIGEGSFTGATAENIANAAQGQFGIAGGAVPAGTISTTAVGKLADTLTSAIPAIPNNLSASPMANAMPIPIGQSASPQASAEQTQRLCPACNQPVVNKKFCTKCGAFLGPAPTDVSPPRVELATSATIVGRNESRQAGQVATSASPPFPFATSAPANQPVQNTVENMTPSATPERKTIGQVLRQTYSQSADIGEANPAPKRTITSLNSDLQRPVPKLD